MALHSNLREVRLSVRESSTRPRPRLTEAGQAQPAQLAPLADALAKEAQTAGKTADTNFTAGLPGRHVSLQIYPAAPGMAPAVDRRFVPFSVPLDSLSGEVDIVGRVVKRLDTGADGQTMGALRDGLQASVGTYQSGFTLPPGSYVLHVLVREQVTGKLYGETIIFDVQ